MREAEASHFFGLDIGTSTVRVVIGALNSTSEGLSVIGHGSAANTGMRKGVVVHIDDVATAVTEALTEAERISGIHVKSVTTNINGAHITGMNSKGVVAISSGNREIGVDDRFRAEEAAAIVKLPPNQEIIQVFAKNYRVDGQDNIKDPIGMHGVRLEVDTHIVIAATPNMKNLGTVLERSHLSASHVTVSSLAAAEAVLTRQQKESGTLLIDIGAGTTNMVIVEDGEVQFVSVLPVGGINITNDLAIGLRTDLDIAEEVKTKYATLRTPKSDTITIQQEGKEHSFSADEVKMITEARVEEILELVEKELKKVGKARKLPGGVVLVGGTAKLPGLAAFTRDQLQLAARVGKLQAPNGLVDTLDDPSYATALGLMQLDMLLHPEGGPVIAGSPNQGAFGIVEGLIKKIKRIKR